MPMVVLSLIRLTDDKINLGQKYYSSLYTIVTNERQLFKYMVFWGGGCYFKCSPGVPIVRHSDIHL